ncbi:HAD family phosphatase [Streptomyces sp. NPDC004610]|uniref:HAD family hydrolase n=1 Tax=unclassified Streptomyces TaxID=2593676 RepID=UPI0033A25DE1
MTLHRILSWTPTAIVFDCDGTLLDTQHHWAEARERVLRERGLTPPAGFAERAKGLHHIECGRLMAEVTRRPDLGRDLADGLLRHFRATVGEQPLTMPGAREMVAAAASFAPLAVASNCPREVVESCLDDTGLLGYFRAVVVPEDTVRAKPHPDTHLTAARICRAAPSETLAVEGTQCGILAAARAGLRVLGVGPWPGAENTALTDLWVDTLKDPRLITWAAERVQAHIAWPRPVPAPAPVPSPAVEGLRGTLL